jgi:small multidrug resistance family-3 protein
LAFAKGNESIWLAVVGAVLLTIYGIIPTLQPASFGRVYAAYGGIFIVLSILWSWQIDKITPDKFDLLGRWACFTWRVSYHVCAKKLKSTLLINC